MLLFLASFVCCYFWHVLHVALYLNMQNSLDVGNPEHSIQLVIKNIQITYCFHLKGNPKCRILGSSYKKQTILLDTLKMARQAAVGALSILLKLRRALILLHHYWGILASILQVLLANHLLILVVHINR